MSSAHWTTIATNKQMLFLRRGSFSIWFQTQISTNKAHRIYGHLKTVKRNKSKRIKATRTPVGRLSTWPKRTKRYQLGHLHTSCLWTVYTWKRAVLIKTFFRSSGVPCVSPAVSSNVLWKVGCGKVLQRKALKWRIEQQQKNHTWIREMALLHLLKQISLKKVISINVNTYFNITFFYWRLSREVINSFYLFNFSFVFFIS